MMMMNLEIILNYFELVGVQQNTEENKMSFETSQTEQGIFLFLKDEVTVVEAVELKAELVKLIESNSGFAIDVEQVTDLDTSTVQLIISSFKAAKEKGVEIFLTGRCEAFESAIKRTGALI